MGFRRRHDVERVEMWNVSGWRFRQNHLDSAFRFEDTNMHSLMHMYMSMLTTGVTLIY